MTLLRRLAPAMLWFGWALSLGAACGLLVLVASVVLPRRVLPRAAGSLTLARAIPVTPAAFAPAPTGLDLLPPATATAIPVGPVPVQPQELAIPKLGLVAPVIPIWPRAATIEGQVVAQLEVPRAFAVGWSTTSAPVGAAGNTVLVGHNNAYGDVFKDLWTLGAGDEIVVYTGGAARRYAAAELVYLQEQRLPLAERLANAAWIAPSGDERLTLVTCWPYYSNTHRLIVVARPVE
jgi:sortase A